VQIFAEDCDDGKYTTVNPIFIVLHYPYMTSERRSEWTSAY